MVDPSEADAAPEAGEAEAAVPTDAERRRAGLSCLAMLALGLGAVVAMVQNAREEVSELIQSRPGVGTPSDEAALPPGEGQPSWGRSLHRAQVRAAAERLPRVVHFEAEWAESSRLAFGGVYAEARVEAALGDAVTVRLDLDAHQAIAERLGVDRLPHLAFLDAGLAPLAPALVGVPGPDDVLARREQARRALAPRSPAEDSAAAEGAGADPREPAARAPNEAP